jgi:multiple sugar transport system ATP-binding protein
MAVVRLVNLTKRFLRTERPAVDAINIAVGDGEFVALLGPSGCGKSTTLRMIAGLEEASAGEIYIDDRPVNRVPAKDRDIAMVFQSYALYPHMTIEQNLAFGLRRRNVARGEIERRVKDAAKMLGLADLLGRRPHSLSGGQRQRVALGRAIVRDPKVFLFDEPLSNLDAALRLETRNEIIRQHQRLGTTMIYVTHDQVEAMTMSQRICIMNGGRVVQMGKPLEIYRNPADTFVAKFLGSPPMNLMPARLAVEAERVTAQLGHHSLPLPAWRPRDVAGVADREVLLGIRPESLAEPHAARAGADFAALGGTVLIVEPLGAETLLSVDLGGNRIIARVGGESRAAVGQRIELRLDAAAVHLFDPSTSKAIAREAR